jgi:hypothetical protein
MYFRERKKYHKDNKKKYADRGKKWFESNKEKVREYGRREVSKNPDKVKARNKVYYAIKTGKLDPVSTKTCEDCGKQAQHHHHEDYSKPLEVVALCNLCHAIRHTNQTG